VVIKRIFDLSLDQSCRLNQLLTENNNFEILITDQFLPELPSLAALIETQITTNETWAWQYQTASIELMRTYLSSIFTNWDEFRRRKLSFSYISNCLNKGTDLNRLLISLSHHLSIVISYKGMWALWHVKKYLNITKCRNLMSTNFFYLNICVVTNKSDKTKNRVFHWCVFSSVNRWGKIIIRAVNSGCQPDLVSARTVPDSVMRIHV